MCVATVLLYTNLTRCAQYKKSFILNLGVITRVFYVTKTDSAIDLSSKRFEKPLKNAGVDIRGQKIEFRNRMVSAKKNYLHEERGGGGERTR